MADISVLITLINLFLIIEPFVPYEVDVVTETNAGKGNLTQKLCIAFIDKQFMLESVNKYVKNQLVFKWLM